MRALTKCIVLIVPFAAAWPVRAACLWNTPPSVIAFGMYSVFSTGNSAAVEQMSFQCKAKDYVRVTLSTGSSGTFVPTRSLINGTSVAAYNLYLDAAATTIWGDANGGSGAYDFFDDVGDKAYTVNIFGVMRGAQDLSAGTFTDTVFATLSYSKNAGGPWTNLPPAAIRISATVIVECRVDSFAMSFGDYDPFNAAALSQSTLLKVYCTKNSSPTSVVLDNGSFPLNGQKRMSSAGGIFLNYSAILGSTGGVSTSSLVPINGGFALNGSVAPQQDVSVGGYSDTLVATVNY